jgi:hypothetical protein
MHAVFSREWKDACGVVAPPLLMGVNGSIDFKGGGFLYGLFSYGSGFFLDVQTMKVLWP